MRQRTIPLPWAAGYGLARTLLALGTLGTLAFSDAATLFREVATVGQYPLCQGVTAAGAFCLVGPDQYDTMRWACCLVLAVAASGWRPRLTALPHAYVAFSVFTGISIPDGGDQITWVLALLIALVSLGDDRRWHWQSSSPVHHEGVGGSGRRGVLALVGVSALVVARVQVAILYFQACVAKLPHAEWADGTALYYWTNNHAFGAPDWLRPLTGAVVAHPVGVAAMTWLPLVVELSLAASLLMPQKVRWRLLPFGVLLHLTIAITMGLWSFAFAMWAGLLLLLAPLGHDPDITGLLRRAFRRAGPPVESAGEPAMQKKTEDQDEEDAETEAGNTPARARVPA
ncbi:HTTM domain-containing protein [Streptomyces sp. MUM 203J]|uniref:sporulation-delaying protein SdpB family protein n=1 Tax=Streptomyces sp. MUM 203J TaxID=2791990 RepID=UPI001F0417D7|nr:sporulation-delaying protein SdpB family protein [Streptomyces sp. MUM 203J]MCH0541064.1 HTTM domain-containing protein [Streptomyces sp. MUM 203J]